MPPMLSLPMQGKVPPQALQDPHYTDTKPIRRTFPISFLPLRAFMLAVVAIVMLGGFGNVAQAADCVCTYNASADYFPIKLQPNYAKFYTIEYHNSYKVMTVIGTTGTNYTYVAYLCGTPIPDEYKANDKVTTIQIPIRSVILSSTSTQVPLVEYVGERQAIRYLPEDPTDLDTCLAKMYAEGKVVADGNYYYPAAVPALKNISLALSGNTYGADVVFTDDAFGDYDIARNVSRDSFGGNATVVLIQDDHEADPIGKIEWINFVAALFNRESAAQGVVANIDARWTCHKNAVTTARTAGTIPAARPKVIWLKYGILSSISCPSTSYWECDVLSAAGADLLYFPDNLNATTFRPYAMQADAMIFPDANFLTNTAYSTVFYDSTMQSALAGTKIVQNKMIFDVLGKVITEWFDSAIAEPDVVLMDLIQALYGDVTLVVGTRKRVFLRNVLTPSEAVPPVILTAGNCTDESAPRFTDWLAAPCTDAGGALAVIPGTSGDTLTAKQKGVCSSASSLNGFASMIVIVMAMMVVVGL